MPKYQQRYVDGNKPFTRFIAADWAGYYSMAAEYFRSTEGSADQRTKRFEAQSNEHARQAGID